MLKVLLAPLLPEGLLRAPRERYRNASQLAEGAGVSVMSAFRFVRQLRQEGFLGSHEEVLRLVRRDELMRRWQAVYFCAMPELPLRWLVPVKGNKRRLSESLSYPGKSRDVEPRACPGLFAAAEQLIFGFVHGSKSSWASTYSMPFSGFALNRLRASSTIDLDLADGQSCGPGHLRF
jgi:hypothetical protein